MLSCGLWGALFSPSAMAVSPQSHAGCSGMSGPCFQVCLGSLFCVLFLVPVSLAVDSAWTGCPAEATPGGRAGALSCMGMAHCAAISDLVGKERQVELCGHVI